MKTSGPEMNTAQWVPKYYQYLKNFASTRISDKLEIEDIIQETFYAGLKSKNRFKNKSSERTWLTAILKNKIVDYYREKNSKKGQIKKRMISHEEFNVLYLRDAAVTSTNAAIEYDELKCFVDTLINTLPESTLSVAKLKIYENLSTEEICNRLNISKGNVWTCMHRARVNIADKLNKYYYQE